MNFSRRDAYFIAGIYFIFGIIWIILTDWLLLRINGDLENFAHYSTIKGLVFVLLSTLVIWFAIHVQFVRRKHLLSRLSQQIDEGKQFEKTMRKHINLLYQLIEQAPLPMMLHTETRQIHAVSHAFTELTGYRLQDVPTIRAWVEQAFPYRYDELYDHMVQLYNIKKRIYEGTYQVHTKDGNMLHWEFYSAYLGKDSKGMKTIITTAIDVTDRKTKEKELTHKSYHDDLTGLYNRRYYNEMTTRFERMRDIGLVLADINGLKLINDVFGHSRGDKLLISFAEHLRKHMPKDAIIARMGGDEFIIVISDFERYDIDEIGRNIKTDIQNNGEEIMPSAAIGYSQRKQGEKLKYTFTRAENMLYQDKIHEYNKQTDQIIESLMNTLYSQTDENREHIDHLKTLTEPMIDALELRKEQAKELMLLVELHDIGKVSIDPDIFTHDDGLDDDQKKEIVRHPEIGYRIANALPKLKSVAYSILTHHENVDGSGYPFGLENGDIPLNARIFRIIESYEVMTRGTHYKEKIHPTKAMEELKAKTGTLYDEALVEIFEKTLEK